MIAATAHTEADRLAWWQTLADEARDESEAAA
jgi:hypothetical protein